MMYGWKGEVPDGEHLVPLGVADVKRPGKDVTIVSLLQARAAWCWRPRRRWPAQGIEAEVVDLRSLRPLDEETVYDSVREDQPLRGRGRGVAVRQRRARTWPGWCRATASTTWTPPVELVSGEDVPMPYNHSLELAAQPSVEKIVAAAGARSISRRSR